MSVNVRSVGAARAAAFLLCVALMTGVVAAQDGGAWSAWKSEGGSGAGWTVVAGSPQQSGTGGGDSPASQGSSTWSSTGSSGWSVFQGKAGSGGGTSSPVPGGAPGTPSTGGDGPATGGGSAGDAPPRGEAGDESPSPPAAGQASVDRSAEAYLFEKLNEERAAAGREPLASDPTLVALARRKALDMAVNQYFDHVSPEYGTVFDMLRAEGIAYKWAGENIGRGASAASIHRGLVDSPEHRANLLSAGYTRVGVGAVRYRGKLYVAQVFMKPR